METFIITNVSIKTYEEGDKSFVDANVAIVQRYEPWQLRMMGMDKKTHAIDNVGNLFTIVSAVMGQSSITYVIRNTEKRTSLQIGNQFSLISEQ